MKKLLLLLIFSGLGHAQITTTTITIPKLIDFKKIDFNAEAGVESIFYDQTNDNIQKFGIAIPNAELKYHYRPNLTFIASALYEDEEFELENLHANFQIASFLSTKVGKQVFNFSFEETTMISDPFMLTLSETKETMARLDMDYGIIHGEIVAFNGQSDRQGENNSIKSWGGKLSLQNKARSWSSELTYSYLNNIADSAELSEYCETPLYRIVDAHHARIAGSYKQTQLITEYMITGDHFRSEDLKGGFLGAHSTELIQTFGDKVRLGISYQRTYGSMYKLDFPKERYSLAANIQFNSNTSFNIELYHSTDEVKKYYDSFGNKKAKIRKYAGGLAQLLISV